MIEHLKEGCIIVWDDATRIVGVAHAAGCPYANANVEIPPKWTPTETLFAFMAWLSKRGWLRLSTLDDYEGPLIAQAIHDFGIEYNLGPLSDELRRIVNEEENLYEK